MIIANMTKTVFSAALVVAVCTTAQMTYAAGLTIGQEPLFLTEGVAPNLFVTLDDSGSMERAYAPDGIGNTNGRRYKSSHYNPLYYNPNATYNLPKKVSYSSSTGQITLTEYTTSFTAAYLNGFRTNRGTVNLSKDYRPTLNYVTTSTSQSFTNNPSRDFSDDDRDNGVAAYYYVFDTTLQNCSSNISNQLEDEDCYRKVDVGSAERQNFANWYSFYRTRALATQTAANLAFLSLPENVRVTWQMLNSCYLAGGNCAGGSGTTYSNRLRNFSGAHRQEFFNWLADTRVSGGTPLKAASERVGDFLATTGVNSPWAHTPGSQDAPHYSCRPSYHILMTDGVWNENTSLGIGNVDGLSRTLPDGSTYTPRAPYRDGANRDYGNTLSDLAFKYWAEDANSELTNDQKPFIPYANADVAAQYWDPRNDPATWQHLVTFTLGLGLTRSLTYPQWGGDTYSGDYSRLLSGAIEWPQPASNQAQNVYELWHAALNSRGEFFSVDSPEDMVTAFKTILSRIADRETSASAVSLESAVTSAGNEAYYARFSSDNWSGELIKYEVDSNGGLTRSWNGRDVLTTQGTSRNIKFNKNGALTNFSWDNLSTGQKAALNKTAAGTTDTLGSARVDYIRGDRSREGTTFRERTYLLGDIIHSSPVVVGAPNRLASMMDRAAGTAGATNSYGAFALAQAGREKRIYVGANDGMLHAFNDNGREVFAFIPSAVIDKLNQLPDKSYATSHQYYVDGTPVVGDIYDGANWRTILVGTLRGGGRSVFALDITNPNSPSLLWEFSSSSDPDLGFTFPEPVITKLHNGKWGVLLGNGYNSTNDKAALFILNAVDGTVIRKLEVGQAGMVNGLSAPKAADINGDLVTDYVYAGDLQGNLWRFDLFDASVTPRFSNTGTVSASTFRVAFNGNPLYTAKASNGTTRQAITSAPTLIRHPSGTGYIVSFGTGKYIETTDAQANTAVAQSIYGIWDRQTAGESATSTPSLSRGQLVQQTMGAAQSDTFSESDGSVARAREFRLISRNPIQWIANNGSVNKYGWYLDLQEGNTKKGELIATAMTSRANVLIAATTTPNSDPCSSGIDRWFIALDGNTGGATLFNVLDMTGNNYVTAADGHNGSVVSSIRIPGFGAPAVVGTDAFFNTDTGIQKEVLDFGPTSRGRQTWRVMGE